MALVPIFLLSILQFAIIYFAVRLAIRPLLNKQEDSFTKTTDESGLVKLRDIGVLGNEQLEEVIELYNKKASKKEEYQQYRKYEKVLGELLAEGYLNNFEYSSSLDKLKMHFNIK